MPRAAKENVVITEISPQFDYGSEPERWNRTRPTVALCMSGDIRVDHLYIRTPKGHEKVVEQVRQDIERAAPHTKVHILKARRTEALTVSHDFDEFYLGNYVLLKEFAFDHDKYNYLFFIPPGKGVQFVLSLVLCITYLNIPCKFIHNKVTFSSKADRDKIEYIIYDVDLNRWMESIGKSELTHLSALEYLKNNINAKNVVYNTLIKRLEHIALYSRSPILLSGESGVGKTYLARRIYDLKRKAEQVKGKFVEVNCGVLRGEGLMSMLFGHTKGSYTGAISSREGLLKAAHEGVLFLDEISEMPLAEQVVLLKAIEEKSFMPFGSDEMVHSNFQLICGTNSDLQKAVRSGTFRHDLLARIGLWHFHLPPLRERPEDIEPNIEHELLRYTTKTARMVRFAPEALDLYLRFAASPAAAWNGNLRALSSSVERMATFASLGIIDRNIVKDEIEHLKALWDQEARDEGFPLLRALLGEERAAGLDLFEKFHLEGTLRVCLASPNRSEAGRRLYARSREKKQRRDDTTRLNNYLKNYGLSWEAVRDAHFHIRIGEPS